MFLSQIVFQNQMGRYDLEVTTFQMAVLFTWNQRPDDSISFESLRSAGNLTLPPSPCVCVFVCVITNVYTFL